MDYERVYEGNLVEIFKVSESLYFRKGNLPVRDQCNGAFIVGEREVAIVDAPPGGGEMLDEAELLFHKPVSALFLTHAHGDHVGGLEPFLERELTVYCNFRVMGDIVLPGRSSRANVIGIRDRADLRLSGGLDLELFILPGTAHSKGDMFIRVPSLEILCTGDCVVEFQTAFFHSADIDFWIQAVKNLASVKGKYLLPGHSPVLLPHAYLDDFAAYLSTVKNCAEECFALFHADPPGKTLKEKCVSVTTEEVKELVEGFFASPGEGARFLVEKAGAYDARRAVRMALWATIREGIR